MHYINELNLLFHCQQTKVIIACEKLKAFKLKLSLWSRRIENKNVVNFPSLDQIPNNCLQQNVKNDIISHLTKSAMYFDKYFSVGELN